MKTLRALFQKLSNHNMKRYCSCGHAISANLPFCPFCGCRIQDGKELPLD